MNEPPDLLDGATVLYWAASSEPFFYMPHGEGRIAIVGLVVCRTWQEK